MKVKCYMRWRGKELRCFCKKDNPGCDRYKSCEEGKVIIHQYEGIKECMGNSERKR